MDDFSNLSDDDLQQLMALGIAPEQMDELKQQIETAQKIRNRSAPQGYDSGRVYTAASPFEHAAYALQGIRAQKDIEKNRLDQQKLLASVVRGRKTYFDRMNEITPFDITQHRVGPPPGGY